MKMNKPPAKQKGSFIADMKPSVLEHLSAVSGRSRNELSNVYDALSSSVQLVFSREVAKISEAREGANINKVHLLQEMDLLQAMLLCGIACALFHLARLYDDGHFLVCHNRGRKEKGRQYNADILDGIQVDVTGLILGLCHDIATIDGQIELQPTPGTNIVKASWKPMLTMNFDHLPAIENLQDMLPGEVQETRHDCAGIAGGGGSDVITVSSLARLFPSTRKMDLVISTRGWLATSQGKEGSADLGKERKIRNDGGPAYDAAGNAVIGTYKILEGTSATGRDLEPAIVSNHTDVYMVLDQGDDKSQIDSSEHVELYEQYRAVLGTHKSIHTVFVSDTGGDVFGSGENFSTPDQDLHAQRAMAQLKDIYPNLVTVVIAPGTDAPPNAPEIAAKAGGRIYRLKSDDKEILLDVLVNEYHMDGNHPTRYSRTTLSLIEWLRGKRGWVGLNIPPWVVNTDQNPWKSFGFVRECMGDIIFLPLLRLLPFIDPDSRSGEDGNGDT